MASDENSADGKDCIKEPWTDKDYKYPDNYQPGPGAKGTRSKPDKRDSDEEY